MINLYYFTDKALQVKFDINLDSHNVNHTNSKITVKPNFFEVGIETRYINKILKQMAAIYALSKIHVKLKCQTVFSAIFDKQDKDNQVLNEIELFIKLNSNQNITESDINFNKIKSSLEHQIEKQRMKYSGWRFDKINSMTICFYKITERKGTS